MSAIQKILPGRECTTPQTDDVRLQSARVTAQEKGEWRLDTGAYAQPAASCLLTPAVGDTVLFSSIDNRQFILHVLARESDVQMTLGHPSGDLQLVGENVRVTALRTLNLGSGGDCDITAPAGALSFNCRDLFTNVAGSWVQSAQTCMACFGEWTAKARELINFRGKRQLHTAEREFKVDADIIHMG